MRYVQYEADKENTLNEPRGKPTHDRKAEGKGGGMSLGQALRLRISWLFLCFHSCT